MSSIKSNTQRLIEGVHIITGIDLAMLNDYAENHNVFDIIDHPAAIGASDEQMEKLKLLKDFINSYQYLRENESESRIALTSPEKAASYFRSQIAYYRDREVVLCAYVDSGLHIISCEEISKGTVNVSALFPRDVLKRALQFDCAGIILSHNHPGRNVNPSKEDIAITKTFQNIFHPLNISLFDHVIIADDKYSSLKEKGFITEGFERISQKDYEPISLNGAHDFSEEYDLCQ